MNNDVIFIPINKKKPQTDIPIIIDPKNDEKIKEIPTDPLEELLKSTALPPVVSGQIDRDAPSIFEVKEEVYDLLLKKHIDQINQMREFVDLILFHLGSSSQKKGKKERIPIIYYRIPTSIIQEFNKLEQVTEEAILNIVEKYANPLDDIREESYYIYDLLYLLKRRQKKDPLQIFCNKVGSEVNGLLSQTKDEVIKTKLISIQREIDCIRQSLVQTIGSRMEQDGDAEDEPTRKKRRPGKDTIQEPDEFVEYVNESDEFQPVSLKLISCIGIRPSFQKIIEMKFHDVLRIIRDYTVLITDILNHKQLSNRFAQYIAVGVMENELAQDGKQLKYDKKNDTVCLYLIEHVFKKIRVRDLSELKKGDLRLSYDDGHYINTSINEKKKSIK